MTGGGGGGGHKTPVAPKKRMGKSTKKAMPVSWVPKLEQSCLGSHNGGDELMEVLLDISSSLQATEVYISTAIRRLKGLPVWSYYSADEF